MKVYFNIRPNSRERMWDTINKAGELCDIFTPKNIVQKNSIKNYENSKSVIASIKYQLSKIIINHQSIDKIETSDIDLLYMWGAFPKNTIKPFIIELDNPYAPAFYHLRNFKRNKERIKFYLQKAYKITFMSKTCKDHVIEIFGKDVAKKSFLNYPYMANNYKSKVVNNEDGQINFLFVGLNGRIKGIQELLRAFTSVENKNIRLTIISDLVNFDKSNYQDERINVLPPQTRDKLFKEIYPKMDILVFPSFYESFGVVLLEAISFGLGVIAVNNYAIPEMVLNNYNGKLINHPIFPKTNFNGREVVNCVDIRIQDFTNKYMRYDKFYYNLFEDLRFSIIEGVKYYREWKSNSIKLFDKEFSQNIWLKNFNKILSN